MTQEFFPFEWNDNIFSSVQAKLTLNLNDESITGRCWIFCNVDIEIYWFIYEKYSGQSASKKVCALFFFCQMHVVASDLWISTELLH